MRRRARRVCLGLLAVVALFAAAIAITARPGDRTLWPPDTAVAEIVVVSHGYHAGIALPRPALAALAARRGHAGLIAVTERFAQYPWLEVGWGDEGFYRSVPTLASATVSLAVRALLRPGNPSVLHVVGLDADPARAFPHSDRVVIPVSAAGFERLAARIDATFMRDGGTVAPDLGPGLYGSSLFYRAVGTFHIFRVCNHWVADMLGAAGLPSAPVLATLPSGLLLDLRWRAGLRALRPADAAGAT